MHTLLIVLAYVGGTAGLVVLALFFAFLLDTPSAGGQLGPYQPEPQEVPMAVTRTPPASPKVAPPPPPDPDIQAAWDYQRLVDEYQAGVRNVYDLGDDILEGRADRHD